MDREAWHAAVYGVSKRWTWLSNWTTTMPRTKTRDLSLNVYVYKYICIFAIVSNTVFVFYDCLVSVSVMFFKFIHVVAKFTSFLRLNNTSLNILHFAYPFVLWWAHRLLLVLAVVNKFDMIMDVQIFFKTLLLILWLVYQEVELLNYWKRLWCWEGLGAGGEGDNRGWDGWMASLTRWTWVSVISGSWWWTGRPGVLQFMGSQRVRHDWATDLIWSDANCSFNFLRNLHWMCHFTSPTMVH